MVVEDMYDKIIKNFHKTSKNLYKEVYKNFSTKFRKTREPSSNISQNVKEVVINIELPGINKKDIEIKLTKEFLEVKTEVKQRKITKKKGSYKKQETYNSFLRKIILPEGLDIHKADIKFKNNILEVKIPRDTKKKIIITKLK